MIEGRYHSGLLFLIRAFRPGPTCGAAAPSRVRHQAAALSAFRPLRLGRVADACSRDKKRDQPGPFLACDCRLFDAH